MTNQALECSKNDVQEKYKISLNLQKAEQLERVEMYAKIIAGQILNQFDLFNRHLEILAYIQMRIQEAKDEAINVR